MKITNGLVFINGEKFQKGNLDILNERIAGFSGCDNVQNTDYINCDIMDATGCYVVPGFIDIHFHGCMGQDFSDASLQGLCQMASYELQNGITSICPATMTLPEENLQQIVSCSKLFCETHWDKKMANLLGINLEGPFISEQKKGAQNSKYILPPDSAMFKRLLDASQGFLKLTTLAPETKGAMEFMFPIQ